MYRSIPFLVLFLISFFKVNSIGLDSLDIKISKAKNDSAKIELLYRTACKPELSAKTVDSLFDKTRLLFGNNKDCYTRFFCFYKIGTYYSQQEKKLKNALENLLIALKIADSCTNKRAIMLVRNKLAFVNKVNENYKAAVYNAHLSLTYARPLKDSFVIAENYTILGNIYKSSFLLDSALSYHYSALAIREKLKNEKYIALTYNNIALVYKNKKEYDKALGFLRKSLTLKQKIKDKQIATSYNNLSIVFRYLHLYDSAVFYARFVITDAVKQKNGSLLREGVSSLAEAYEAEKDIPNAFLYYKRLRVIEDSTNRNVINSQYQDLQSKYESDKKDSELKSQEDAIHLADVQNSKKNILILFSFIALLMAIVAGIFIYRSYRINKRNAVNLSLKNKLIEQKNKEITDSINYAKNIQQSLLTSQSIFQQNLNEHFVLFMPKDIVSGDFYWAFNTHEGFIIVCADCTGHGVPGAFMSLLGISYLTEIVVQKQVSYPNSILDKLRERLVAEFDLTNNKDGMDASLIKIKGNELQMSAANNPVWIIRGNECIILKPNKFPIGKHYGETQSFTLNTFQLQKNDLIIQFTDGYADQFGGPENKKYKYKKLIQILIDNNHKSLEDIKKQLEYEIKTWTGKNEQVDDILIIGVRV